MRVVLIFRKSVPNFFSIEKIFEQVQHSFPNEQIDLENAYLPTNRFNIRSVLQNLNFARKLKGDIFHLTGHVHYVVLCLPRAKTILTIHDCSFLATSKGLKRTILKFFFLYLPTRNVSVITTVSEKSKSEILSNSKIDANKVIVIPNPISNQIFFSQLNFNSECPRILLIGTKPNKNIERTFKALKGIKCHVRIIGKLTNEQQSLASLELSEYSVVFNISESDLSNEYAKSDLVIFASTYEGFGLPLVESQKAGRPVITSNISPLKEVAGTGAVLVDPYNIDSIRQAVLKVIDDKVFRENIIGKGLKNSVKYSLNEIAGKYYELYKMLDDNKGSKEVESKILNL